MDHAEAIQMTAVERYMLADLSVSEVEEFERHFFDCPQCSEELRILSVLRENARAVFIEQNPSPSISGVSVSNQPVTEQKTGRAGWRIPWTAMFAPRMFAPALAMLALAVFLGYEIGGRKAGEPQAVDAYPLYAASRGAETVVAPPASARFFTLYMDRTWDRDFASYRAVVYNQTHDETRDDRAGSGSAPEQRPGQTLQQGIERVSMPLPAPLPGRAIQVLFPARALASGRYVLTILGKDYSGQEVKVADYSFTLRFL